MTSSLFVCDKIGMLDNIRTVATENVPVYECKCKVKVSSFFFFKLPLKTQQHLLSCFNAKCVCDANSEIFKTHGGGSSSEHKLPGMSVTQPVLTLTKRALLCNAHVIT